MKVYTARCGKGAAYHARMDCRGLRPAVKIKTTTLEIAALRGLQLCQKCGGAAFQTRGDGMRAAPQGVPA